MKNVNSSQFSLEVEQLKNNQEINQGNKLRQLNLYLDQEEYFFLEGDWQLPIFLTKQNINWSSQNLTLQN